MTFHLDRFSVIDHFLQIFFADTDNRLFHPFLRAVAGKGGIRLFTDFQIKVTENVLQQAFRCMSLLQKLRNGGNFRNLFLQSINDLFIRKRHKLDDKSACLFYRIILIHEYAESHRGRHLL